MKPEIRTQLWELRHYYKNLLNHHRQGVEHCQAVIKQLDEDLVQDQCTLTPDGEVLPVPTHKFLDRGGNLVDWGVGDE